MAKKRSQQMERDFLAKKLNQPDGKLNAINAQLERDLAVANNHPKKPR